MDNLYKEYVDYIKNEDFSLNTLDAYIRDVKKFLEFVVTRKEKIKEVETATIMIYAQLMRSNGKANTSIVRNLISIRKFYKYLIKRGIVEDNPVLYYDMPKLKRNLPEILTIEEVDKLLSVPDLETDKGVRDRAMLEVMYATGMKVSELLNLKIYDINIEGKYIKCLKKNKDDRLIPIGRYAINILLQYFEIRNKINCNNIDLVFFNMQGKKMTRQGFWKTIKYYTKEAQINKKINCFTLRHSFAVHLLQNGADISMVKDLLGHRNMATTQVYSSLSKKSKMMEIYIKAHPRA